MPVDKKKRAKSRGIVDQVHGKDTEAFLNELVNDEFSDWHLGDGEKETKAPKPEATELNCKLTDNLPSTKATADTETSSVPHDTVKGKEPVLAKPAPVKATVQQPQRKWTRFPKREPATQDKPVENAKDTVKTTESGDLPDSKDDPNLLSGQKDDWEDSEINSKVDLLSGQQNYWEDEINAKFDLSDKERDDWEDRSNAKFEVRHKKMENYLEDLRHDGRKRRSSSGSLASTSTTESSSSQDQYLSACTEEELIGFKIKDVQEKFKNNVSDSWMDDVELALLVMRRKSKTRDLKNDEIKNLLNNILEKK